MKNVLRMRVTGAHSELDRHMPIVLTFSNISNDPLAVLSFPEQATVKHALVACRYRLGVPKHVKIRLRMYNSLRYLSGSAQRSKLLKFFPRPIPLVARRPLLPLRQHSQGVNARQQLRRQNAQFFVGICR